MHLFSPSPHCGRLAKGHISGSLIQSALEKASTILRQGQHPQITHQRDKSSFEILKGGCEAEFQGENEPKLLSSPLPPIES